MALIQRPVKTLGNREYAQEKAANPNEPIKSAEVDGDLDTIYALVNGQLDTANLKANANIVGTQLAPGANILGSQLSPSAGITAGQLAAGTLTGAQLAIGAAVRHYNAVGTVMLGTVTTTEGTFCTVPLTTSGGYVLLGGWWDVTLSMLGTVSFTVSTRVRRDGAVIQTIAYPLQGNTIAIPVPTPMLVDTPPAGAHTYTFTGFTSNINWTLQAAATGLCFALEFA